MPDAFMTREEMRQMPTSVLVNLRHQLNLELRSRQISNRPQENAKKREIYRLKALALGYEVGKKKQPKKVCQMGHILDEGNALSQNRCKICHARRQREYYKRKKLEREKKEAATKNNGYLFWRKDDADRPS